MLKSVYLQNVLAGSGKICHKQYNDETKQEGLKLTTGCKEGFEKKMPFNVKLLCVQFNRKCGIIDTSLPEKKWQYTDVCTFQVNMKEVLTDL